MAGSDGATEIIEDFADDDHVTVVTVTDLYMFMGRELESLDTVPAGNVLGWFLNSYIVLCVIEYYQHCAEKKPTVKTLVTSPRIMTHLVYHSISLSHCLAAWT